MGDTSDDSLGNRGVIDGELSIVIAKGQFLDCIAQSSN